jgi:hypothetical protein
MPSQRWKTNYSRHQLTIAQPIYGSPSATLHFDHDRRKTNNCSTMSQNQPPTKSQFHPSIPRVGAQPSRSTSAKENKNRFEDVVNSAITTAKIAKDASGTMPPLTPLKASLGMVITFLETVKVQYAQNGNFRRDT